MDVRHLPPCHLPSTGSESDGGTLSNGTAVYRPRLCFCAPDCLMQHACNGLPVPDGLSDTMFDSLVSMVEQYR